MSFSHTGLPGEEFPQSNSREKKSTVPNSAINADQGIAERARDEHREHREAAGREPVAGQAEHLGIRLLRVVILAVCYFVLEIVAKTVTVAQFIFFAWKKRPHAGMQRLGNMIAEYMRAMWRFCTFASDDAPWPFSPWPRDNLDAHN
jgi:hypothetical protein